MTIFTKRRVLFKFHVKHSWGRSSQLPRMWQLQASRRWRRTVSSIWRTLSCSQASSPSMMTTSLVWFWVKLSMVFAIRAISSTSHLRTCVKEGDGAEGARKSSRSLYEPDRKSPNRKKRTPQSSLPVTVPLKATVSASQFAKRLHINWSISPLWWSRHCHTHFFLIIKLGWVTYLPRSKVLNVERLGFKCKSKQSEHHRTDGSPMG